MVALFVALFFAGSPLLSANHAHNGYDDTVHCAICSFASTFIALGNLPSEMPGALAPVAATYVASERVPISESQLANCIRAPPPQFS